MNTSMDLASGAATRSLAAPSVMSLTQGRVSRTVASLNVAEDDTMAPATDFRDMLDPTQAALSHLVSGDAGPYLALWSQADDVNHGRLRLIRDGLGSSPPEHRIRGVALPRRSVAMPMPG